ncbi:hypothetical protein [Streptomyces microflavus]|uniref:hypothetical protein n=1 Tax=Streptomyces microflavus TaxID=1919 RepID=UPI0033269489
MPVTMACGVRVLPLPTGWRQTGSLGMYVTYMPYEPDRPAAEVVRTEQRAAALPASRGHSSPDAFLGHDGKPHLPNLPAAGQSVDLRQLTMVMDSARGRSAAQRDGDLTDDHRRHVVCGHRRNLAIPSVTRSDIQGTPGPYPARGAGNM